MNRDDTAPKYGSMPFRFERKCEREFKKLLENSDVTSRNTNMPKNSSEFLSTNPKRCKMDDSPSASSSSSMDKETVVPFQMESAQYHSISESIQIVETSSNFKLESNCENIPPDPLETRCISSKIIEALKKPVVDLSTLSLLLNAENLEDRCQSYMSLAVFSLDKLATEQLTAIFQVINCLNVPQSHVVSVSYSLLLLALTKNNLSLNQISSVENLVLHLTNFAKDGDENGASLKESSISLFKEELYLSAVKVCQECFSEKKLETNVDILTICCSALRNLSCIKAGESYNYSETALKFVLGMMGKATQKIASEYFMDEELIIDAISTASYMVNQCLSILEHDLSLELDSPCKTLEHEDFSVLHCLTRLLEWCTSFLFQNKSENEIRNTDKSLSAFHLATLVSILKIFSILSFNPDQFNTFTNMKGLMEKVMICILKVYFESNESHFDVLLLALELMINLFIKHKKAFGLLCLKNFSVNGCNDIVGIEGFITILCNTLDKITEIANNSRRSQSVEDDIQIPETEYQTAPHTSYDNADLVLADEDMKLNTIVSFIGILIAFFMEIKTSYTDFVRERLSADRSRHAVDVSQNFLQFVSFAGGMPATGILLLKLSIRKLSSVCLDT